MQTELLSSSPLESARFGLTVMRGKQSAGDSKAIAKAIFESECDLAIIRVPSATGEIHGISRWALPCIHADTLVYYKCDLRKHVPQPLRNADLAFRRAGPGDIEPLRALIAETFLNYKSHYHANPLLPREKILAGYQEWAESHALAPDRTLWIAERNGRLTAFAACSETPNGQTGEGVLYGVAPGEAGGGVYGDLIRHTQSDFAQRGFPTMLVSTQVNNFAVQKVWAREGFYLFEAWDTYHVNALLSPRSKVSSDSLTFTKEQVAAFAAASGDVNPIHLDDDAAREAGFPGRISHGVLAAAELSRILGTKVPGPGTIFGRLDMAFIQPVLAGEVYEAALKIPGGVRSGGPMHAVFEVRDAQSRICVYAHTDIILR
ncbi:GNAT family N-acetyltransferase [Pseudoxanthomonas sp. F11]|uniref:GNAT family N-acetyltransferase n=1 Tax=Pseudoxanthomonas sp. F11 TaxID=3126308 RepID=UPI00300CB61F